MIFPKLKTSTRNISHSKHAGRDLQILTGFNLKLQWNGKRGKQGGKHGLTAFAS